MSVATRRTASCLLALTATLGPPAAHAISFELDIGDGVSGTLNSVMTLGVGVRMQDRSIHLVSKSSLNPQICGGVEQDCQGVFRDQIHPSLHGGSFPGAAKLNIDDGNWNYDKHDLTQMPFKVTQDVTLAYGDLGFFAKWMYFYDFVNNDFTEFHPNMVTPENRAQAGTSGTGPPSNVLHPQVFGPGLPVYSKRTDPEVLRQVGTDLQLFDYYFYGTVALPFAEDKQLTYKIGNQTINWGESTALVINSINQVNPVNVNNLFRVGFDLSELFIPTGMVVLSTEPFESTTVEAFYGYEWQPLEIPAPGSFFSFVDIGTNNAVNYVGYDFGTNPEDPFQLASPPDNPLDGVTNTTTTILRVPDNEASDSGQFGISLKYFAEWLNNGTEIGFYFMNYHSKLPYVSLYAADASCLRREGNTAGPGGTGIDAVDLSTFGAACPDLPAVHGSDPENATDSAVALDTVRFQLEYPEDIKLYGISFNTTVGDISLQGEVAYRPDMPLQVDAEDLAFFANGPTLGRCHDPTSGPNGTGCTGSDSGGTGRDGTPYGTSDFEAYPGHGPAYPDTFALLGQGVMDGSARSFPTFIGAWRGVPAGETAPNAYIRGWENFDVWQLNLGGTYVQGATDNVIGADQLIWLFEVGAQYVPDLPGTDVLQIDAPGTHYHASAGADGTMTGNYQQDCSHTPDCHFGPDGARFNPHQQELEGFADDFSWGYVIISLIRYESVFPGISFAPITIFQHDVHGTSTDVAAQFTKGRKDIAFIFETRYKEALSFNFGYLWFTGGGSYNLQKDRDQALAFVKYLF